jgi:E3 ubiquitin ligase/EF hand domain-containing protein
MSDVLSALKEWAKVSPADDFWLWATILIVATIAGFFFAFKNMHSKRIIEDTPTSKIRSAAQGYLELVGHGRLMEGQPIVSPLTGTTCTWYEFKVEEHRQSGKNSKWVTVKKGLSDELFLIKDETGQCIIDPEGAHVTVSNKSVWYGSSSNPTSAPLSSKKKSSFLSSLIVSRKYRYTEKLLHSGESLYAIGLYKTVGGAGASFDINEDVRELIREWKTDTEALMKKFDTNKDGEIDLNEWQKVREEAYEQIMVKHSEQKTLPPVHLMNKTNDRRRPYILSAIAQDDLTRRLHLYAVLSITTFIICGSLSTLLVSVRLAT